MNQATLGQAKAVLAPICGAVGMPVTDARVIGYINKAVQELSQTGDYPGVVDRWNFRFNQLTGVVALPYYFDRLMQVTTDSVPRMIVSPWYEFVAYGPGIQDDFDERGNKRRCWTDVVIDRGEAPVQRQVPDPFELTGPWTLRVYAAVDENISSIPPNINIQGLDAAGLVIRSLSNGTGDFEFINGVNFPIDINQAFTTSAQQFSKVTGVSKPETNGYVRVTAWNGTVEVELSNYAFNETTPSYRHYFIPSIVKKCDDCTERDRILMARCRKRFVPVTQDEDILMIGNLNALEEMIIAQWKRLSDRDAYVLHKTEAVVLMRAEANAYYGKSRIPALTFQKGFSIGAIPFAR